MRPYMPSLNRFLAVTLLVIAALNGTAATKKPNIVFILADDLGYGELGCYGQKKIATPNIDRLAADGMRFTQCYSGSHVCAPSRSTLMTGLHTGHTPIRSNGGDKALYDEDITTAEVLQKAGYVCGGYGKWGLGTEGSTGRPTKQGFEHFFGFLHQVHAHFFYPYWVWNDEKKFFLPENEGRKHARYVEDDIHKQALNFIRQNKDKNFFCYIPYTLPHVELAAPESAVKPYLGKFPEKPFQDPRPGYLGSDTPFATFAGMVTYLDTLVGQVMSTLKELDLDEKTIVVFTSDNGPQGNHWQFIADFFDGNGPFRGYKGEFYEGGIREPMIVRWPGKVKAGSTNDHVLAFWDVMPTLAELAGTKAPKQIDGISFAPTLLGKSGQKEHDFLYWEMPHGKKRTVAVRMGNWKAVKPKPDGAMELYDLGKDIAETTDVSKTNPAVMAKIDAIVSKEHSPERNYGPEKDRVGIDDYVK